MDKERDERKTLMHSEIHFRGYWVQLQSRIRKNDDADDYLEGYLDNPLVQLRDAWDAHHENPRPAGDQVSQLYNTGESVSDVYNYATCIATLYKDSPYGEPPGSFPPTLDQIAQDPMTHFKFFIQATENGTTGGMNAQNRGDAASKSWVKTAVENVKRCRKACKHIWDTALATFTSAKATTVIAGLPYGAGPALLKQIENQQERQTTMALFTLFDQLISIKLGAKETFAGLYARILGIRTRLANWKPPIKLPDQLIIVCLMRLLPRQFHGTRTIIMSTPSVTLRTCRDMLLDAENRDAERVKRELGTANPPARQPNEGTGLVGEGQRRKKKFKNKKRKKAEKSEKFKSEGPCSYHGSKCSHASSECYILHPELKPDKKGESDVAEGDMAEGASTEAESQPYGFMNEELGYCLMMFADEKEDDTDEEPESGTAHATADKDDASTAYATPVMTNKSKKVYAVAIGHQTGIFLTYEAASAAYKGYPGAKFKGFKSIEKAKQYLKDNEPPTASYTAKKVTRKRPKNYGWSQKGTKQSRRESKALSTKNVIKGQVLQCKRSKAEASESAEEIRRMARTGGIKDITEPEVIDLSMDPMRQEGEKMASTFKIGEGAEASTVKDAAAMADQDKALRDKAVKSLAEVIKIQRTKDMGVRSRRSFAPGLTTTMVHPTRVSRSAVSEASEDQITFEIRMDASTLQRLIPGATVKLAVSSIEGPLGEALTVSEADKAKVKDVGPYDFMNDCAEDSEDDDPVPYSVTDGHDADSEEDDLIDDLSEDDDDGFCGDDSDNLVDISDSSSDTDESDEGHCDDDGCHSDSSGPGNLIEVSGTSTEGSDASDWNDESSDEENGHSDSSEGPSGPIAASRSSTKGSDGEGSSEEPPQCVTPSSSSTEHWDTSSDTESEDDEPPEMEAVTSSEDEEAESNVGRAYVNSRGRLASGTALDSGATEHCAKHVDGQLNRASVGAMAGLNGTRTAVKGMGKVNKVSNVMCMPGISRNLLSVGRLIDQYGGKVAFTKNKAHLVNQKRNELLATRDGSGLCIVCNEHYKLDNNAGEALVGTSLSLEVAKRRVIALHKAFSHASLGTLRTIIKNHNFNGVTAEHLKLLPPCEACLLGKAHKAAKARQANDKATRFAERLCADCSGPFRTCSVGGSNYLLVVICEFSAWTWVFPISSLQQVVNHLRTLLEVDLHQRDDRHVKYFRSDGGTEFNNKKVDELLATHGVVREVTCANTSYQNGKAERRIRTLFDRVRTTLSDASLYVTRGFWADATVYSAYTLNRTPTEHETSPFELRYGRKPKVSHLRPFGNPCVVYRKRTVAGKLEDAGVKGTFLGYGYVTGKKGYRVRLARTNSVVTTRDVSFCAFESRPAEVQVLPEDTARTPNAIITEPANAEDIDARLNVPVRTETAAATPEIEAPPVITKPVNAEEAAKAIVSKHTYLVGAKVEANWREHGSYYPAVVTAVNTAGANGSRTTYDLVYECDGEAERNVSNVCVRPRTGKAKVASKPCGHALVTDCNPAYLADVPDLARAHVTPKHYGQASKGPDRSKWTESMKDELESLRKQGVYAFVNELPTGEIALRCLWVYKVKCGPNGEVTRYKSRLTVNGKSQRYGIDYQKTFSPVAFATSIRLLFALGIANKFKFRQYDIKCAFLYADLPKQQQVYMHAPPGSGRKGYWLLRKSLYGLCQAPMLFNGHLDNTLKNMGFESCTFDPCLYIHRKSGSYLVVVVDDMVLAAPSDEFADNFYKNLSKKYDVKDMGQPSYVIGVRVSFDSESVKFTQDRYISDLCAQHKPGVAPTSTPAAPNVTLCASGIHKQDESPLIPDPTVYRSLVGGLMYTLITRPDVATAVSVCARYVQAPREAHLDAAKRILRFLHHTRERPLVYTVCGNVLVKAFVDSSWGNDVDTRRSRFGYAIYVGKSLVAWCSKLHPALAMSSAEAEYTAATEAVKSIKWIVSLMSFLGAKPQTPVPVYEDNAACRIMAASTRVSGRNKHFELRQHFVRNQVSLGLVKLLSVKYQRPNRGYLHKTNRAPSFRKTRNCAPPRSTRQLQWAHG